MASIIFDSITLAYIKKCEKKTMKCVHLDCGKKLTDEKEILTEVQKFYSSLFSDKNSAITDTNLEFLLENYDTRKLTDIESDA